MGPPGSGKGAQAERLVAWQPYLYVGAGQTLRREIRRRSTTGQRIARYVATGRLVPTPVVETEVLGRLRARRRAVARRGAVLDGFPRTRRQAEDLLRVVAALGLRNPLLVVHLRVSSALLAARLRRRGRPDDTQAAVRRRLHQFRSQSAPVLRVLRRRARVIEIDGTRSITAVARTIRAGVALVLRQDGRTAEVDAWNPRQSGFRRHSRSITRTGR